MEALFDDEKNGSYFDHYSLADTWFGDMETFLDVVDISSKTKAILSLFAETPEDMEIVARYFAHMWHSEHMDIFFKDEEEMQRCFEHYWYEIFPTASTIDISPHERTLFHDVLYALMQDYFSFTQTPAGREMIAIYDTNKVHNYFSDDLLTVLDDTEQEQFERIRSLLLVSYHLEDVRSFDASLFDELEQQGQQLSNIYIDVPSVVMLLDDLGYEYTSDELVVWRKYYWYLLLLYKKVFVEKQKKG